jgi:hypothetical protein
MRLRRLVGILLDLALFAASVDPAREQVRVLVAVLVTFLVVLAAFWAVVLAIGLVAQREPPYEF